MAAQASLEQVRFEREVPEVSWYGPWYGRCHAEMVCAHCALVPLSPGDRGTATGASQRELLDKLSAPRGNWLHVDRMAIFDPISAAYSLHDEATRGPLVVYSCRIGRVVVDCIAGLVVRG